MGHSYGGRIIMGYL